MRFLLINGHSNLIGGVTTLVVRMARWLTEHEHSVDIFMLGARFRKDIMSLYPPAATVHVLPVAMSRRNLRYPWCIQRWSRENINEPEVVICLSSEDLILGAVIARHFNNRPLLVPYVVCQWEYLPVAGSRPGAPGAVRSYFINDVPNQIKFFMNDAVKAGHERSLRIAFPESHMLPLPIRIPGKALPYQRSGQFRIVSVGRLDPGFKTYNHTLLPIFSQLKAEGFPVSWDIYCNAVSSANGRALQTLIENHGLQTVVNLRGEVSYDSLEIALRNAFAFVGMGTAAIEASAYGIPAIIAIAACPHPSTYGFLYELPFGDIGEDVPGRKEVPIKDKLHELMSLSDREYNACRRRSRYYAERYDEANIMPQWINTLQALAEQRARQKAISNSTLAGFVIHRTHVWAKHFVVQRYKNLTGRPEPKKHLA